MLSAGRRDRLDATIVEMAADCQFTPVMRRLSCLRGISTLTAFTLAVEIGDWQRFSGAGIGAYLGMVPRSTPPERAGPKGRSPRPATGTPVGCWSRRPGITASRPGLPRSCARENWPPSGVAYGLR